MGLMWWVVIGIVVGGLARWLITSTQPIGLLPMLVLGLVGSVVGGYIGSLVWNTSQGFHMGEPIACTVGAVLVVTVFLAFTQRDEA